MSFGSEKKTLESDRPQGQTDVGNQLGTWLQQNLAKYEPGKEYTGQLTAPMSAQEKAGMGWLDQYLGAPATGELYGAGKEELMKTLTGKYDPRTSEYYKSFREGAMTEEEKNIDRQRRGAGYRGTLFQDTSLRGEQEARTETTNYLNKLLGTLSESERQRKLSAVGPAMEYEKYGAAAPLAKASAATTIGALPRLLEQADLETKYNDFLRKQKELGAVPGQAQQYYGTQGPNYGLREYESESPFERIMKTIAPIAGTVLGGMFAGPMGAAAGGAAAGGAAAGGEGLNFADIGSPSGQNAWAF